VLKQQLALEKHQRILVEDLKVSNQNMEKFSWVMNIRYGTLLLGNFLIIIYMINYSSIAIYFLRLSYDLASTEICNDLRLVSDGVCSATFQLLWFAA
ncbi:hypothetical protein M8C21_027123, partial [Ambrosia artemisiifolia]